MVCQTINPSKNGSVARAAWSCKPFLRSDCSSQQRDGRPGASTAHANQSDVSCCVSYGPKHDPANKSSVRLNNGTTTTEVWTCSTVFTSSASSGFLGQTSIAHRVGDPATAQQYLDYWSLLTIAEVFERWPAGA